MASATGLFGHCRAWKRAWGRLGAPLLIALLGLFFFGRLVRQPDHVLYSDYSDFLTQHIPNKYFLVGSWRETGELPLWCPYNFGGMPFVHDAQVSAFYPAHGPLHLLPREHLGAALSWIVVLHVIAAGWAMWAYARHQGLEGVGALVAAVGYMFAGKWLLHLLCGGHYVLAPLAWLPLVLLALEEAIRRRSGVCATAAGIAFALIVLGTHPQLTLYSGAFAALWTLGNSLEAAGCLDRERRTVRQTLAVLGRWLGMGAWAAVTAALLSAVQWLPALEVARHSSRTLGVTVSSETWKGALRSLLGLVGPPVTTDSSWLWEDRAGFGLLWLAAAACAPVLVRQRRVRLHAGLALFWLLLGLGGAALLQKVPGFHLWRLPSRLLLLTALPVALLAGATVQALVAAPGPGPDTQARCRRRLLKLATLVLVPLSLYATLQFLQGREVVLGLYWAGLVLTVPVAWWLLGERRPASRLVAVAWFVLLLADLWTLAGPFVVVHPENDLFAPSTCQQFLIDRAGERGRVLDVPPVGRASANSTPLWPASAQVLGVEPVRGYNPLDVLRYKEYLQFLTDRDEPLRAVDLLFTSAVLGSFAVENPALADLLGVRYLVQPSDLPLEAVIPDAAARQAWRKVHEDPAPRTYSMVPTRIDGHDCGFQPLPPCTVYENQRALPRAFVVPEAAPLPERPLILPTLKTTDFRRRVLLEDWEPGFSSGPSKGHYRPAEVVEYLPNRVVIDVPAGEAGYLVLTDVWFPGWVCTVDGQPVRIYRANYLFRAVVLPEGSHRVVFAFAPASYSIGKAISAMAALAVLGGVVLLLVHRAVHRR